MNRNSKSVLALMVVTLLSTSVLTGCGKDKANNAVEAARNTAKEPSLMGTWESECKESKLLGSSMKDFYKFSGNDLIKASEFFTNSECRDPIARLQYEGSFKAADENPRAENSRNLDLTYEKVVMAPLNGKGVNFLKLANFCGRAEWQINKKEDLSGASAAEDCPLDDMPVKKYDIARVEDNKLFLGRLEENEGATPEDRPDQLNRDVFFVESKNELSKD